MKVRNVTLETNWNKFVFIIFKADLYFILEDDKFKWRLKIKAQLKH